MKFVSDRRGSDDQSLMQLRPHRKCPCCGKAPRHIAYLSIFAGRLPCRKCGALLRAKRVNWLLVASLLLGCVLFAWAGTPAWVAVPAVIVAARATAMLTNRYYLLDKPQATGLPAALIRRAGEDERPPEP